jgi:hypothetical protein
LFICGDFAIAVWHHNTTFPPVAMLFLLCFCFCPCLGSFGESEGTVATIVEQPSAATVLSRNKQALDLLLSAEALIKLYNSAHGVVPTVEEAVSSGAESSVAGE